MSSNFERKSLEDLKEQSRRQAQIAAELEPCLTVTEKSWKALIGLQQTQIQFLVDVQEAAARLTTRKELVEYLDQRVQELESCAVKIQSSAQNFQREMEQSAAKIAKNLSSQAGRMSEADEEILNGAVLDRADPIGNAGNIGTNLAYLSADIAGIIDENHRPQDSTTMRKPRQRKRALGQKSDEQDQNHGYRM